MKAARISAAVVLAACGEVHGADYTSIAVTATFKPALLLDRLAIRGFQPDGSDAFSRVELPEDPRPMTQGRESVVILVDDQLAGSRIQLRVDGFQGQAVRATGFAYVYVIEAGLSGAEIELETPAVCGDGRVNLAAEACDDRNTLPGDGCSASCTIEPGHTCVTAPPHGPSICSLSSETQP